MTVEEAEAGWQSATAIYTAALEEVARAKAAVEEARERATQAYRAQLLAAQNLEAARIREINRRRRRKVRTWEAKP